MQIVILGGGISGLSLAWFLHRFCDVIVLEKEKCAGGWLKTDCLNGFLFDRGPRTFRLMRHHVMMDLITELGLEPELIYSAKQAQQRYLLGKKGLSSLPKSQLILGLCKEWPIPYYEGEETIAQFGFRRFNREITETLFDAMALGVYGGDMHELSINACFPKIKEWEKRYGSLAKAIVSHLGRLTRGALFSFKEGSETLSRRLVSQLNSRVKLEEAVTHLRFHPHRVEVMTQKGKYDADYVISALPAPTLTTYFPRLEEALSFLKMQTLQVVHCGFKKEVLHPKGFGYLVPTREKESILGAVFDSHIFPQHNKNANETRLTFMVREGCDALVSVQEALKRHLNIREDPSHIDLYEASEAIAQFRLGHREQILNLKKVVEQQYPRLHLAGNYLSGVSVADCIATSKELSVDLLHKFHRDSF